MRQYRPIELAQQLQTLVLKSAGRAEAGDQGVVVKVAGNEVIIPRQDSVISQRVVRSR